MAWSRLIFDLLCFLVAMQSAGQELEPPAWTRAPDEKYIFVVTTEEFSNHLDVTNGLIPAVKTGVIDWAKKELGTDCGQVIESMPLETFRELVYQDQEFVHESRRTYDEETAKRLDAEFDMYYRGFVRVHVNERFRSEIQTRLTQFRLKNRLCSTWVASLLIFGVAAIGWGYMFANRLSRGFYIGRLRWLAGISVGALVVVCYLVCQLLF